MTALDNMRLCLDRILAWRDHLEANDLDVEFTIHVIREFASFYFFWRHVALEVLHS